jgi:hypothetical protein
MIGCVCAAAGPVTAKEPPKVRELSIRPNPEAAWGAPVENVHAVLQSAAEQLWQFFPERTLDPILVEPKGGPIVIYQRGPHGEYLVRLGTGELLWAQHAYQFAHEFCHILCRYNGVPNRNKWFEESLCETASLFALRRMSKAWAVQPPYPNWKDYGPALATYANERIDKARLPKGKTLAAWFREESPQLYANAALRDKNTVVAVALLPLFEAEPRHWESVAWLNDREPPKDQDLAQFLEQWQAAAPARQRAFIAKIADKFGVKDQMKKPEKGP